MATDEGGTVSKNSVLNRKKITAHGRITDALYKTNRKKQSVCCLSFVSLFILCLISFGIDLTKQVNCCIIKACQHENADTLDVLAVDPSRAGEGCTSSSDCCFPSFAKRKGVIGNVEYHSAGNPALWGYRFDSRRHCRGSHISTGQKEEITALPCSTKA